jgi:hypothetical protein
VGTVPLARVLWCGNNTAARVSGSEKNSGSDYHVSEEGLPRNWMILLGHKRLQYIGEEPLGMVGG